MRFYIFAMLKPIKSTLMGGRFDVVYVSDKKDYDDLRFLFLEYEKDLGFNLSFQDFNAELDELKSMYAYPEGAAYIIRKNNTAVACIAVRKLENNIAEIKRMFVRKTVRGKGYGKLLLDCALIACHELGYERVRLDTLDYMKPAIKTYKSAGFYEIPPYRHNPFDNAVFMEKVL